MEIKPLKKIRSIKQAEITAEDFPDEPRLKPPPPKTSQGDYRFANHKIYFQGKEIGQWINETLLENPQHLARIANELEDFRERCLKRRSNGRKNKKGIFGFFSGTADTYDEDELAIIFALCDAYIKKISDHIKKRYDETKDGLTLTFDGEGQLILNAMNIHALVDRCRQDPNPKSLLFLKGIRSRLDHVLENKVSSRNYERIREVILDLFQQIDAILGVAR